MGFNLLKTPAQYCLKNPNIFCDIDFNEGLTGSLRPLNLYSNLQLHYAVNFSLIDVK